MARKDICPTCGKSRKYSIADTHRYAESGLENVYLKSIETVSCGCGDSLVIKALPSLLRIIAVCFAYKPARLRGNELRFVRHVISKTAKDFARSLSISPEHLSRLEKSTESLPAGLDKLVRARMVLDLISRHPELVSSFDLDRFMNLFEQQLPTDDEMLALFVKYRGPYIGADQEVEFEFKHAA